MRKKFYFIPFIAAAFFFSCGDAGTQKGGEGDMGKTVYTANCLRCHGEDGGAGLLGASDLRKSVMDDNTMYATIKEGKGAMVGFYETLSDEQVYAVIKYVKGLKK